MTEKTYNPSFPLNQFIDLIWIGKANFINVNSKHHAPLFTELIFNFGDSFNVTGQNIENLSVRNEKRIISGLKTQPFTTEANGKYGSLGIILKPFCYGLLIEKFGTKSMDVISEILFENVYNNDEPDFELAEKHLLNLFSGFEIDSDILKFERYISQNILERGALKQFNLSLAITQKSFIQKFKKHFILTPNQYIKLKKVNAAIHLLQNTDYTNLSQVGLEAGFYDQSHFIKVFKDFCGTNPKGFEFYKKEGR